VYVRRLLEEHCATTNVATAAVEGRPSVDEYATYQGRLNKLFQIVKNELREGTGDRYGKTRFLKWAAFVPGEKEPTKRTHKQWEKIFADAEKCGDFRGPTSAPVTMFSVKIDRAADKYDARKAAEKELKEAAE
jgi:hypothetical protein